MIGAEDRRDTLDAVDTVLQRDDARVLSDQRLRLFGGFLGVGEHYHPLPWRVLRYDEKLGGYEVGLAMDKIKEGPSYQRGREPAFDAAYYGSVYGYYGI